jgi:hypothetical protein
MKIRVVIVNNIHIHVENGKDVLPVDIHENASNIYFIGLWMLYWIVPESDLLFDPLKPNDYYIYHPL